MTHTIALCMRVTKNKQASRWSSKQQQQKKNVQVCSAEKQLRFGILAGFRRIGKTTFFFFNNRIQLATQSDRGKNNRKPDTVCYMERTKKKKSRLRNNKKKMAHPLYRHVALHFFYLQVYIYRRDYKKKKEGHDRVRCA